MFPLVIAALAAQQVWYLIPLTLAASLVWGATRHELPAPIIRHAVGTAGWILGFMGVLFLVLWVLNFWV